MRTVRGPNGCSLVLLKESHEASLVYDPEAGRRRHVPTDDLGDVDGTAPLETAGRTVSESTRERLPLPDDDAVLGLLVEIALRAPLRVRTMLAEYDRCESDLHGLLAEFRAADLVAETTVGGERAYEPTSTAVECLDVATDAALD